MKVIFVDGASLFSMGRAIGLRRGIDFTALYDLLTRLGAERRLAAIPVIVLNPDTAQKLKKAFTGAGFDVLAAETKDGSDDQVIIDRIQALDVGQVKEVILVSNDRDYTPVLKFKVMEGLADVYWVGTDALQGERSGMGRDLKRLLKAPGFHFVELADHKNELAYDEHPPARAPALAAAE